jgi:hypothetical protein
MAPDITLRPTNIATTGYTKPEHGLLVFADGALVAVVSQLDGSLEKGDILRGHWFLEAGFGPCATHPSDESIFESQDEAQDWVLRRILEAR